MKCPKCQVKMMEGYLIDKNWAGGWKPQVWGTNTKIGAFSINVENETNVKTYKCKNCGYLESYAK